MRAVICKRYGAPEVLELADVPTPTPDPREVRVQVHATTAHVGDTRIRAFRVPAIAWLPARFALGFLGPRNSVLGMEIAGVVDQVGAQVSRFQVGDEVVGFTGFRFGGYAEYICIPVDGNPSKRGMVVAKPASLSFAQAAPLAGGGVTALLVLRKADIQPGQRVLIYGASGSIGTFAVQLCKHLGAHVTAVCSTSNLEMVRSLGADEVVDYTVQDVGELGATWHVVFDAVDKFSAARAKGVLHDGGIYLNIDRSSNGVRLRTEDLVHLTQLAVAGNLRSVIDRRYPLEQVVEAHRYVDLGHKKGNVVLDVVTGIAGS